jgi:hypothetical protein
MRFNSEPQTFLRGDPAQRRLIERSVAAGLFDDCPCCRPPRSIDDLLFRRGRHESSAVCRRMELATETSMPRVIETIDGQKPTKWAGVGTTGPKRHHETRPGGGRGSGELHVHRSLNSHTRLREMAMMPCAVPVFAELGHFGFRENDFF